MSSVSSFTPLPGRCGCRYLSLIQEGARHWQLDGSYVEWLGGLAGVDPAQRGPEYYSSPQGLALEAWPKIRTGSGQQQGRGHGRGAGRGAGWSGGRNQERDRT